MRTFTKLREFSKHYNILAKQIMAVERKSDKQFKELKKALEELMAASDVVDEKVMGFLQQIFEENGSLAIVIIRYLSLKDLGKKWFAFSWFDMGGLWGCWKN